MSGSPTRASCTNIRKSASNCWLAAIGLLTRCDTEAWVHLYEDLGEKVFGQAHGQYGVSLWDRERRTVYLARDRIGISPLFYAEVDGWLLWASEIKSLLASGMISAAAGRSRPRLFLQLLLRADAAHLVSRAFTRCHPAISSASAKAGGRSSVTGISIFPIKGAERRFANDDEAAEELEAVLRTAIRRRLCGEVPLSCYISGGLDSTVILGLSSQEKGEPIPSFTISLNRFGPLG